MKAVAGKHAGTEFTLSQFANDWISGDGPDGAEVFSPPEVQLTTLEEFTAFEDRDPRNVGTFWGEWRLLPDGTFQKILSKPPRRIRRAGR